MAIRSIRNRIVHEYLPEQVAQMSQLIAGPFENELSLLHGRLAPGA